MNDDDFDPNVQASIYSWAGYVECLACADLFAPWELSELGFCPMCEQEIRDMEADQQADYAAMRASEVRAMNERNRE